MLVVGSAKVEFQNLKMSLIKVGRRWMMMEIRLAECGLTKCVSNDDDYWTMKSIGLSEEWLISWQRARMSTDQLSKTGS